MSVLTAFLFGLLLLIAASLIWVRRAPDDPARWHVDPRSVVVTSIGGWKIGPGTDSAAPVLPASPEALLAALDRIAMATDRTARLAGSPEEGRITYVTRSALIGFPDYTTVEAERAGDGATIVAAARQRYGKGDMGVNRRRLEDWITRLAAAIDAERGL